LEHGCESDTWKGKKNTLDVFRKKDKEERSTNYMELINELFKNGFSKHTTTDMRAVHTS
jgi:hypothetical protein